MSVASAMAALRAASVCSRSKAVQELAALVLGELDGWAELDAPEASGPLSPAERARDYRKRKRHEASRQNVTNVTESVTERDVSPLALSSLSSSPDFKLSSEIPDGSSESTGAGATPEATPSERESSTQRVAKRARGTRVPVTETTAADLANWCALQGVDPKHPEFPRFLDHWRAQPGQRGVKLDWGATWRNWIRRAPEFTGQRPVNVAPAPYHPDPKPQRRTDGMRCGIHGREACKCPDWQLERTEAAR